MCHLCHVALRVYTEWSPGQRVEEKKAGQSYAIPWSPLCGPAAGHSSKDAPYHSPSASGHHCHPTAFRL